MLILALFIALLQCIPLIQVHATSKRSVDETDLNAALSEERLPRDVAPTSYVLEVHPFPEEGYFKGRVTIDLTFLEETDKIVLHADSELTIYHSALSVIENDSPTRRVTIQRSEKDPERSWYTINLRKALSSETQAQLSMIYTGKLDLESQKGLFRSSYKDTNTGEDKYYVASAFKPNFARKVFPCFDEPEFKTPFTISIVRKITMTALSNMPLIRSDTLIDPTWVRDYFKESPPMSTYNLGIVISDFSSISHEDASSENNFDGPIQIWVTPDTSTEAVENFTKVIRKAVDDIGDLLGVPYALPKLDYVIARGLNVNNWGLILQSESEEDQIIGNVVSQWIGSLVTPASWNDEIINYGLESYIIMYIMFQNSEEQVVLGDITLQSFYIMSNIYSTSKPIEDISLQLETDAIKITMLFRILNYTLGETTVKHGLQGFISDTKYKSYMESDIWNSITEQAHIEGVLEQDNTVNEIASSWISQNRVPLLTVKRNYRDNSAIFSQQVYQSGRPLQKGEENDYKWWIPIVLVKEGDLDFTNYAPKTWLKEETLRLTKVANRDQFVIVNPEEIGPFPVNYDEKNWKLLSEYLQTEEGRTKIPVVTRAKLLRDALHLGFAGELNCKAALEMILFLDNEDSHIVWKQFIMFTDLIGPYLRESTSVYEKSLRFVRHLLLSLNERLEANSYEDGENEKGILKPRISRILCNIGYIPCIEEARHGFEKWIEADGSDSEDITTFDISDVCVVIQWGSDEEFELALQRLLNTPVDNGSDSHSHDLFMCEVRCANKPWKVQRILNISIFEQAEDFSDFDIENILQMLTANAVGYKTLLEYLTENWAILKERFEDNEELWKNMVEIATSNFKTKEGLDLVLNFYSEKREELGSLETIVEKSIKNIEEEMEWSTNNLPVIEEWLDNYFANHEVENDGNFLASEP